MMTIRLLWLPTAAALLAVAAPAGAQGVYVAPRVGVEGVYDDNLYGETATAEEQYYTRLRPLLGAGWDGRRFDLGLHYGYDTDLFGLTLRPEQRVAAHVVNVESTLAATRRLMLGFSGSYIDARYGYGEASGNGFVTGIEHRVRTRHAYLTPGLTYSLSGTTSLTASYNFMREQQQSLETQMHEVRGAVRHRLGSTNALTMESSGRVLRFDDGSASRSVLAMPGWEHHFTRRAALTLAVGARLHRNGEIQAEAIGSLRRIGRQLTLGAHASRLQTTVPGVNGPMRTTVVGAHASRTLGVESVVLTLEPGWYDTEGPSYRARVARLDTSLRWAVSDWVAITATYQLSRQWFFLGTEAAPRSGEVDHTLVSLGVSLGSSEPIRI